MKGTPSDMQNSPRYSDVIAEIKRYLRRSIGIARAAGVKDRQIIIDPGIGFGKTVSHNLEILARLDEFASMGYPVCVGTSRKSFIGKVLGLADTSGRLAGSIATCVMAAMNGASILRVHDVRETVQAIGMLKAVTEFGAALRS
jgi:dihydropteroate synthase